jgi:phosphohistidine phosphatase
MQGKAMRLYIVRHAIAVPHGAPGINDDDRPLTEEGINSMRQAAGGLYVLGWIPNVLLSSPLIRARQTAEILVEAFCNKIQMKIVPSLSPSGSRRELYREMNSYDKKNLMIVGHQPSLGEIAGEICWNSAEKFIEFKKGGACAIELESTQDIPKGRLIAFLTSSILRKVVKDKNATDCTDFTDS